MSNRANFLCLRLHSGMDRSSEERVYEQVPLRSGGETNNRAQWRPLQGEPWRLIFLLLVLRLLL
eukprot:CAMPEP_0180711622 /NCGR_PEP_ID=MMETSP1038_2-20121128/10949_1 /TAXON_ID=632150 /ORGANISM="Azadinium spinosum, Strain 3D9" /LENGTH=63 /DNA_ID=CAMNT_0022743857 /DNA_START=460 /DNA_END=648 /DNA_ORIENTATION=+